LGIGRLLPPRLGGVRPLPAPRPASADRHGRRPLCCHCPYRVHPRGRSRFSEQVVGPAKVRRRIRRRPTRPTGRPPNEVWQIPRTPRCQVSTCRLPAQTVLPGVAGPRNSGSRCCPPERCRRSLPLPGAVVPRRWRRCWDTHRRDTPHQGCADRSALPRVLGSMVDGSPGSPPGRRFPPRRGSPGPAMPLVAPWSEKPPHRWTANPVLPGTARQSPGARYPNPRNHTSAGERGTHPRVTTAVREDGFLPLLLPFLRVLIFGLFTIAVLTGLKPRIRALFPGIPATPVIGHCVPAFRLRRSAFSPSAPRCAGQQRR